MSLSDFDPLRSVEAAAAPADCSPVDAEVRQTCGDVRHRQNHGRAGQRCMEPAGRLCADMSSPAKLRCHFERPKGEGAP